MNLKHHFLLSMPSLVGDYFANSLTYICEHSDEGAMGLMVNRPSTVSLLELMSHIGLKTNRRLVETPVLEGGPVATERGFVLHSNDKHYDSSAEVGETLLLSTAMEVLDAIANDTGPAQYMVTLGYAGWGAGQLEAEIQNNIWLTTQADARVLFESPFESRLDEVAASMGVDLRLIARPGHA